MASKRRAKPAAEGRGRLAGEQSGYTRRSGGRAPSRKAVSRRPAARRQALRETHRVSSEARYLGVMALGMLIFVFVYIAEAGGFFGGFVRAGLLGMTGAGAYILPFMLIGFGIKGFFAGIGKGKAGLMGLIFLCFLVFWSIPSVDVTAYFGSIAEYIGFYFGAGSLANGGLMGSSLSNILLLSMGVFGSYVLVLVSALILVASLTSTSLAEIAASIGGLIASGASRGYAHEDYDDEHDGYVPEELVQLHREPRHRKKLKFSPGREPVRRTTKMITIEDEGGGAIASREQTLKILRDEDGGGIVGVAEAEDEVHPFPDEVEDDIPPFDIVAGQKPEHFVNTKQAEVGDAEEQEAEADAGIVIKENTNQFIDITGGLGAPETQEYAQPQRRSDSISVPQSFDDEDYTFPPIDMLHANPATQAAGSRASILENSRKLEQTLKSFGVEARVVEVSKGPTVTRYELSPGVGVKVSRISALADDLALNLAAVGIRIEAPIPGKAAVGIEIPNKEISPVHLREVIEDEAFRSFPSKLAFALGKDIAGNTIVADIAKMPHLLIAGATGSGKSVCINTLVTSIIYKAAPKEVKLLMIDPKVVELSIYNGIPHLLIPVVTDPKKAAGALFWAVQEMVRRYNLFAEASVRDLKGYNAMTAESCEEALPQIVIIIDELADLMMVAPGDVEDSICRLAQMARAAGLHLIIATQRPSVDVITGLIKANVPSRLAFAVSSGTDSRTILDTVGAERLLGKGDMLFNPVGLGKPQRIQGAFISDKEVEAIVGFIKRGETIRYDDEMIERITLAKPSGEAAPEGMADELFDVAAELVISKEKASASMLQRQFRIGYNRASRLIEELEERGIVGPEDGAKPRKVLMNAYQWQEFKGL